MSTLRYFLGGHVRLTYLDQVSVGSSTHGRGGYRCFVKPRDGKGRLIIVGEPAFLRRSVDCPEAFDDAARAAIAFATDKSCAEHLTREDPLDVEYDFETVGGSDRIAVWRKQVAPGTRPCPDPDCPYDGAAGGCQDNT